MEEEPKRLQSIWDFLGEENPVDVFLGDEVGSSASPSEGSSDCQHFNSLPEGIFEEPCQALCTAGGTAAFFCVKYRPELQPTGKDLEHFIAKDLAHAKDEVYFYEKLRRASRLDVPWAKFGEMAMECPGIAKLQCINPKLNREEPRQLLLLENLRRGFVSMRLLDIKLGAETSVAHWKGKSRLHSWKNRCVDQRTNSALEGFRLEGIELPSLALQELMTAVVDAKSAAATSQVVTPKAIKRFVLQRLRGAQCLAAWLDVSRELGPGSELHAQGALWAAFREVGQLLSAVLNLPVPQQWIGSSIALALEVGKLSQDPRVVVRVFDWGRAELSTAEDHAALQPDQKQDRVRHWPYGSDRCDRMRSRS